MKNTTYITIIFVLFYILSFVWVVMSQIRLNETQKRLDNSQKQLLILCNL